MDRRTLRTAGAIALVAGSIGLLFVATLGLFFVGLFGQIRPLLAMGTLNDLLGPVASGMSALLASVLHPFLARSRRQTAAILVAGTWLGALVVAYGAWRILTGRSGVEHSSYHFFVGNGLIGVWLWQMNRAAQQQELWPHALSRLGFIASLVMLIGLLGLYGIVVGSDGEDFSPLVLTTGVSFIGIGVLYPLWCLRLGRWIVAQRDTDPLATQT